MSSGGWCRWGQEQVDTGNPEGSNMNMEKGLPRGVPHRASLQMPGAKPGSGGSGARRNLSAVSLGLKKGQRLTHEQSLVWTLLQLPAGSPEPEAQMGT